jgi:hypothetical protein
VARNVLIAVLEWLAIWNCRALTPLSAKARAALVVTKPQDARTSLDRNSPCLAFRQSPAGPFPVQQDAKTFETEKLSRQGLSLTATTGQREGNSA